MNVLTVITNESYKRYAEKLQTEYGEADGITKKQIGNARDNKTTKRNDKFKSADFNNLWNELTQETDYTIKIDTEKLIAKASVGEERYFFAELPYLLRNFVFYHTFSLLAKLMWNLNQDNCCKHNDAS